MKRILPDRVAIVGPLSVGGGGRCVIRIRDFLESHGVSADVYDIREISWWFRQKHRLLWRFDHLTVSGRGKNDLAKRLRAKKYPVIIAVESGDIFYETSLGDARKVFFCHAPIAHEMYYRNIYRNVPDPDALLQLDLETERKIYRSSDFVTVAWNTYEKFIRENVYDEPNLVSHPGLGWYGCDPQSQHANYCKTPRIAYIGSLGWYSNPELLSMISSESNYSIDSYGVINDRDRPKLNGIQYKGMADDEYETLRKYQFGLNTVTTDPVRISGFSSKVLAYLSVGLPTLSPDWQLFSHQVRGVIPYVPASFNELIERYRDEVAWNAIAKEAIEQAYELEWNRVLNPLLDIL